MLSVKGRPFHLPLDSLTARSAAHARAFLEYTGEDTTREGYDGARWIDGDSFVRLTMSMFEA